MQKIHEAFNDTFTARHHYVYYFISLADFKSSTVLLFSLQLIYKPKMGQFTKVARE